MESEKSRIILVEDSPTQAVKLCSLFEIAGLIASSCASAEEALRTIAVEPPDLLVVDYYLPGIRGDDFCRRIRMGINSRHIPILMFTVDDTHAMELRGLDSGADDYISKSADPDILIARVRSLLRKGEESRAILRSVQSSKQDTWMLAVDDSPTYLEKVVLELEAEGYKCDRASSGAECLQKIGAKRFDCVILDLVMPGIDGIEVCRKISGMRHGMRHPISVLMLTGQEGKEDLTRALEAGADDFVGKSSEIAVLKGRIRALLRRNFYLEENRKMLEELKAKEKEAVRAALIEKEAAQVQASLAQQLAAANRKLQETNKELEAFSYSVSHDLRAPLRTVNGFSQLLLEDCSDKLEPESKNYLNRIREGCQRMTHLIDDLLQLSRVISRTMRRESVNLSAIVREIADGLSESEPERKVDFAIADKLIANGDPGLLRAALENLLNNAWKFTSRKKHAKIEFGIVQEDDQETFFVRDDGAGFDMAHADKLFGAFQRLHSEMEFPGTGIGLATVQRVIRRHGGRLWAKGEVDKGAAFYFVLPREDEGK